MDKSDAITWAENVLKPEWKLVDVPEHIHAMSPLTVACGKCGRERVHKTSISKLRNYVSKSETFRDCPCTIIQKNMVELQNLLSEEWTVFYVGATYLKPGHVVCHNGHTRALTLKQARSEARKSPDGLLWCNRCNHPERGTTPPINSNPFIAPIKS